MTRPGDEKKSAMALMRRMLPHARKHLPLVWLGLVMIPIITGAGVWRPLILKRAIDESIAQHDLAGTQIFALWFIGAVILEFLATSFQTYAWQRAGHSMIYDLRQALFEHVLRLPARLLDKSPVGTMVSRVTNDVDALGETMAFGVFSIVTDVFLIAATLVAMLALSVKITLASLALAPFLFLLVRYFSRVLRRIHASIRQAQGVQIGYLTEQLSGSLVLQLFGRTRPSVDQFSELGRRYTDGTKRANVFESLLFSLMDGISAFCVALLLYVGARGVVEPQVDDALTLGLLFAFVDYLQRIFVPIKEFSGKLSTIQRAVASLDRIFGLLDETIEAPKSINASNMDTEHGSFTGAIRVADLHFAYNEGSPDVLRGLSFAVKPGQVIALVGRSGSGKSSLGRLLTRTYTGFRGAIEVEWRSHDGDARWVNIVTIDLDVLRQNLLMVQQDVFLFDDSVRFNVSLGREDLTSRDDVIWDALRTTQADEFIAKRGGLDSKIGPRGCDLSSGQAQLVAFSRVAAWAPPILILDEATSSVDSMTERKVQAAIERLFTNRTVLVIAHRLSTIRHADHILVLDQGQIVERGDHDELMAKNGRYAQLYRSGFVDGDDAA
jgi:ATP-binding cassette subfamily B protein